MENEQNLIYEEIVRTFFMNNPDFHNKGVKAFKERDKIKKLEVLISHLRERNIHKTVGEIQATWNNMEKNFRKNFSKENNLPSGSGAQTSNTLPNDMLFLAPSLCHRQPTSSIASTSHGFPLATMNSFAPIPTNYFMPFPNPYPYHNPFFGQANPLMPQAGFPIHPSNQATPFSYEAHKRQTPKTPQLDSFAIKKKRKLELEESSNNELKKNVIMSVVKCHHQVLIFKFFKRSMNDAGVLMHSDLGIALNENVVQLPPIMYLPGSNLRSSHYFVGDGFFPLKTYLMKPFNRNINLTVPQRIFNYRLSHARRIVECAFGQLSQQWQVNQNTLNWSLLTNTQLFQISTNDGRLTNCCYAPTRLHGRICLGVYPVSTRRVYGVGVFPPFGAKIWSKDQCTQGRAEKTNDNRSEGIQRTRQNQKIGGLNIAFTRTQHSQNRNFEHASRKDKKCKDSPSFARSNSSIDLSEKVVICTSLRFRYNASATINSRDRYLHRRCVRVDNAERSTREAVAAICNLAFHNAAWPQYDFIGISKQSRSACRALNGKHGRREQHHFTLLIYTRITICGPAKTTYSISCVQVLEGLDIGIESSASIGISPSSGTSGPCNEKERKKSRWHLTSASNDIQPLVDRDNSNSSSGSSSTCTQSLQTRPSVAAEFHEAEKRAAASGRCATFVKIALFRVDFQNEYQCPPRKDGRARGENICRRDSAADRKCAQASVVWLRVHEAKRAIRIAKVIFRA
ncbi:unnamed protein product, partial [Trichogramma brassicae]